MMRKQWSANDLLPDRSYVLALAEAASGRRYYVPYLLTDRPSARLAEEVVFVTMAVPDELLRRKDFLGIAEAVRLDTGDRFHCTAHGTWLSSEENEDLDANRPVRWARGRKPQLF